MVPIKTTIGRSTGCMTDSPYGLWVALSTKVFEKCYFYTSFSLLLYLVTVVAFEYVTVCKSGEPHLPDRCF